MHQDDDYVFQLSLYTLYQCVCTGDVQGTVHRDIMKEFESELQVGSALVLRQVYYS